MLFAILLAVVGVGVTQVHQDPLLRFLAGCLLLAALSVGVVDQVGL